MPATATLAHELARLEALRRSWIARSKFEAAFDSIARLVQNQLNAAVCLISFVDETHQWFKAHIGTDVSDMPRDWSYCATVVEKDEQLAIIDTLTDPRGKSEADFLGDASFRSYLGHPLRTQDGYPLGALCVMDRKARIWSDYDQCLIAQYAELVETLIAQSENVQKLEQSAREIKALTDLTKEHDQLLASISEVANVGGWILDVATSRLEWTQKTREIHEVDDDFMPQLEGALDFYAPEGKSLIEAAVQKGMEEGVPWDLELPLITAKGRHIWVRAYGRCESRDGEPKTLVGAFQDITDLKARADELEQRRMIAEDAASAKTRFLATMSHELRTPLNGVVALAGALADTELTPDQVEMVELLQKSGEGLNMILSDILDLSKIEEGKLVIKSEPFQFSKSVRMAVELLRLGAEQKGLTLVLDLCSDGECLVKGDDVRIRQIVTNLVSNAIKFTHAGSIVVKSERLREEDGKVWVRTSVTDTGIGLSVEDQKRVFNRFEQVDGSLSRAHGGVGLGLWICQLLCESMGGTLALDSVAGSGSTFYFDLPFERVSEMPKRAVVGQPKSPTNAKLKVLLAEDHSVNQRVFSIILKSAGIEFDIVDNGQMAFDAWLEGNYSIVLMDIQMPVLDGLSAIRMIRQEEFDQGWLRTPIAALSANAMAEHVQASLEAGADAHMAKPLTPDTLLEGIYSLAAKSADAELSTLVI